MSILPNLLPVVSSSISDADTKQAVANLSLNQVNLNNNGLGGFPLTMQLIEVTDDYTIKLENGRFQVLSVVSSSVAITLTMDITANISAPILLWIIDGSGNANTYNITFDMVGSQVANGSGSDIVISKAYGSSQLLYIADNTFFKLAQDLS